MYKDKKVSVIIAAAGSGKRMGGGKNKQYIKINGKPVLAHSVEAFERNAFVDEVLVSVKAGEEAVCRKEIVEKYGFGKVKDIIAGGKERHYSVMSALQRVSEDCGIVLVHDGARPMVTDEIINDVIASCMGCGAAVPGVPVKDTIKSIVSDSGAEIVSGTPDRSMLRAVQTPQGFRKDVIDAAYAALQEGKVDFSVTDDASLVEALGGTVAVVPGDVRNIKITTPEDVIQAEGIMKKDEILIYPRTGMGYDVHAFAENRKLILGGVDIPYEKGLLGHSDADVLLHAIMDALLGACGLGDIGRHFPDSDERYRGISSLLLLGHTGKLLSENGWKIINIDAVVIAQKPKVSPYIEEMKKNIAEVLKISVSQINIKGTTTEKLGFTGREEGIAAQSVAAIIHV